MFIPQVLHLLLSTISSLVKLSIRKQYNCLTSAQFSWIFSGLVGLDGWMTAAERYGDLQGLNKAETTNKYGEEKVGPGLYKKLFFFWSMLGCGKFSTLATLSVRRKLLKLLKKKQVTQWRRSYAVPPPPIKVRFITMKHRGGGGGMLKDSCQRVILAGETFEGFVAVETRVLRYFKRSNFLKFDAANHGKCSLPTGRQSIPSKIGGRLSEAKRLEWCVMEQVTPWCQLRNHEDIFQWLIHFDHLASSIYNHHWIIHSH